MHNVTLRSFRATIVTEEKAISITYSECMFVPLDIQHVMGMRHAVIYGPPLSTIFFHLIT
jgi:hypothetical protein